MIRLFEPPFDGTEMDPGYIRGYVPGVRENGGQYTHAAIWAVMAVARLGNAQEAWRLFSLLNPIRHADSPERAATYKVEPYVVAADVYSAKGHEGRGGWTWYTGSAGWMYRLLVEDLLGLRLEVDTLTFRRSCRRNGTSTPCITATATRSTTSAWSKSPGRPVTSSASCWMT